MASLRFSERASRDLAAIVDYTREHWGIKQAAAYLDELETIARSLADHPSLGRSCAHLIPGLASFPAKGHVLFYQSEIGGIVIVRILHKSMAPERHLLQSC